MNIFILDEDIQTNAQYHCDKHCVKMILEYAQLLCSALHCNAELRDKIGVTSDQIPYKLTHKNHPCAVWVRESIDNYSYLSHLFSRLCKEYEYRYNKSHASYFKILPILSLYSIRSIFICAPNNTIQTAPQCMPDEYKRDSVIDAYRAYYKHGKTHLHKWTNRPVPDFILKD